MPVAQWNARKLQLFRVSTVFSAQHTQQCAYLSSFPHHDLQFGSLGSHVASPFAGLWLYLLVFNMDQLTKLKIALCLASVYQQVVQSKIVIIHTQRDQRSAVCSIIVVGARPEHKGPEVQGQRKGISAFLGPIHVDMPGQNTGEEVKLLPTMLSLLDSSLVHYLTNLV